MLGIADSKYFILLLLYLIFIMKHKQFSASCNRPLVCQRSRNIPTSTCIAELQLDDTDGSDKGAMMANAGNIFPYRHADIGLYPHWGLNQSIFSLHYHLHETKLLGSPASQGLLEIWMREEKKSKLDNMEQLTFSESGGKISTQWHNRKSKRYRGHCDLFFFSVSVIES